MKTVKLYGEDLETFIQNLLNVGNFPPVYRLFPYNLRE